MLMAASAPQKMSNLDYHYSVLQMRAATSGHLNKIHEIGDGGLFRFQISKRGEKFDIVSRLGRSMSLTQIITQSDSAPSSFASLLRKHLENSVVEKIEQVNYDRLVKVTLQKARAYSLYFEMFAKGNLVFCDEKDRIIAVYRKQEGGKRIIARGGTYAPPAKTAANPFDEKAVEDAAKGKNAEELPNAVALPPAYYADFAEKTRIGGGDFAAAEFAKKANRYASDTEFCVYLGQTGALGFSCVKLHDPEKFLKAKPVEKKKFPDFGAALDYYDSNLPKEELGKKPANKKAEKLRRQKAMLQAAITAAEEAEKAERAKGDAIYLHYEKVSKALERAAGRKEIEIEL